MTQTILVQPGTTLFEVAAKYLGDATQWFRIAQINIIRDPYSFGAPTMLSLPTNHPVQG
jgi:hypothetical protein